MRIIQSAWSCHQKNLLTSNSGWLAPEYNFIFFTNPKGFRKSHRFVLISVQKNHKRIILFHKVISF